MANRLSKPLTLVASFENFWPNASDRLCAGSVDYQEMDEYITSERINRYMTTHDEENRLAALRKLNCQ